MVRRTVLASSRPCWESGLGAIAALFVLAAPSSGCWREDPAAERRPQRVATVPFPVPATDGASAAKDASAPRDARPRLRARLEFPGGSSGAQPSGVLASDLDGDGRDEVCAVTIGPGSVQVWSGLSAARVEAVRPNAIAVGDYPLPPVWAELEPGKKAIVAVASRAQNTLTWVDARAILAGDAEHAILRTQPLERRPRAIASGDLGRDGIPDVAVITIDDSLVLASGELEPRRLRLCDEHATCARFLAAGDAILFGFQGSRRLVAYTPTAANEFGLEPSVFAQLSGLPRELDELDFDGDGDLEIAVVHGDRSLSIYGLGAPGGPLAGLRAEPVEIETGAVPIDLAHGDFDGDGRSEIAVVSLHALQAELFAFDAGDVVRRWEQYAGQHPWSLATGDFDGDRALDLVIANPGAQRLGVFFGDGRGALAAAVPVGAGRSPHSIAAGDLDLDGRAEIVALEALGGAIAIFDNDAGALARGRTVGPAPSAESVGLADLDGDGLLDAAFLQRTMEGSMLVVYFGDGLGGLATRASVPPLLVGASAGDLLLEDLDGDGRVEVVAADPEGGRVVLVERTSKDGEELRFAAPRALEVPSGPRALAALPRTAEGCTIAVALGGPGPRLGVARLRAQRDAGVLVLDECAFHATTQAPLDVAAGDFDGDGLDDLALLVSDGGGSGFVVPLVGDAPAAWRELEPLVTGARPYRVVCGDLDGDRRDEILASAQNSHNVDLWLARAGTEVGFARAANLGASLGPLDLLLVDLDGDGARELVVANAFSDQLSVIATR